MFAKMKNDNTVYFSPSLKFEDNNNYIMNQLTDVELEAGQFNGYLNNHTKGGVMFTAYHPYLEEKLNFKIKSGKWITKSNSSDDIFNAVIDEKEGFKIGEVIEYLFFDKKVTICITGLIEHSKTEVNISGSKKNLDEFIIKTDEPIMIIESKILSKLEENFLLDCFIVFNNNISKDDYNTNIEILNQYGSVSTIANLFNETNKSIKTKINVILPFAILSGLLSLCSLIAVVAISYDKTKKT